MSRFYDSQLHSFQNIENIQKEQIRTTSILPVSNSTLPVEVVKFCLSQANYMYEDYRNHKDALIAWIKHLTIFFTIAQIIFSGPLGSVSLVLVVLNIQYCLRICLRALLLLLFGFNVTFNNYSIISRRCLVATGSAKLTFIVLPHWSIMPTFDMIPYPVTLSWHWVDQS